MLKRYAAALTALSLLAGTAAHADYVIKDGAGASQTFGSFSLSGVQFPKHAMVDPTTGAAIGVSGNPMFVSIANFPASQAVTAVALPLPTGAAQDATITARLGTLGQKASAASAPVVIASDQAALSVTGTFYQATQPVSASALPLPSGAATVAAQNTIATNQNATAAGTSATNAQAVQGVTGGVPLPTTIRSAGTNRSANVTTTASVLMAANTSRQGWKIKNDSAVGIWINFDATATAAAGSGNILIPAGGYLSSEPGFVETGAMSAIAVSSTAAITAREY
jgi:hypothetical protein